MAEQQSIPISQLSIEQLNNFQKALEGDIAFFATSLESLKGFADKVNQSIETVEGLAKKQPGDISMVPLTESTYIRAELVDPKTTLVELGTGFFAEIPVEKAEEFFRRKLKNITENTEKIEKILLEKRASLAAITDAFRAKVSEQMQNMPMPAGK